MSNILILHSGLTGMTNACIQVAKRLEADGKTVFTSTMIDQEKKLKRNKLNCLKVNPIKHVFDSKFIKNLGLSSNSKIFSKKSIFRNYLKQLDFSNIEKQLEENKIDLVLIDMELHEYIIFLKTKGFPFILLNQWFSMMKTSKNFPLNSQEHKYTQFSHTLEWTKSKWKGIYKTLGHNIKTFGVNRRNFILFLARKMKFDNNNFVSHQFPLPFAYKNLPCISLTHSHLEIDEIENIGQFYAMPMVHENRVEDESTSFNKEFENILTRLKIESKSLIVLTGTTMEDIHQSNIENILEALNSLENCISIVSIKNADVLANKFKDQNVIYFYDNIPQLKVLKQATVSINHGGIHTINECIHFNVPMLIYSGNKYDQDGCTARINRYGCGIGAFKIDSTQEIVKKINNLLSKEKYKERIRALNKSYLDSLANKEFENYINSLLH